MKVNLCNNAGYGEIIVSYDVTRELTAEEKREIQDALDTYLEEEEFDEDSFIDYFYEELSKRGLISYDNPVVASFYI